MLSLLYQFVFSVRKYVVSYVYVFVHAQLASHVDVHYIFKRDTPQPDLTKKRYYNYSLFS